jgi:hypothetical protein
VRAIKKKPDPVVPEWLRNHGVYTKSLFEFDEPSGIMIMRAGYYMGESFVRTFENLRWSIGDEHARIKTTDENMPVVTGFRLGTELPVVLVAEILLKHVASSRNKLKEVKECIEFWCADNQTPVKI